MMRRRWASSTKPDGDALDLALLLEIDHVGAVAHDLGDLFVSQVPLQRAESDDVVGQVTDQRGAVGGGDGRPLGVDGRDQRVVDPAAQFVGIDVDVGQHGPELADELLMDPLPEGVQHGIALEPAVRGSGDFLEAVAERHGFS